MGTKIKKMEITGLRGIQDKLSLQMEGKSILLYGENGSGKSSISDVLEWFYKDKVSHLSSNEIDMKEALRNTNIAESDDSTLAIQFNKAVLNAEKNLSYKKGKLVSEQTNNSEPFLKYLVQSEGENLILRYQLLREFVDQPKGDKLKILSDIIGYSNVTKVKEILKKAFNSIKSEIKSQNFENQINTQKNTLKEKLGAIISQRKNLFEIIGELIKGKNLEIEIKSFEDIDKVLTKLRATTNNKLAEEIAFLRKGKDLLENLQKEISLIDKEYDKYYSEFEIIANDVESIMQTFLGDLLKAGNLVLTKKYHKEETCPLCLQPKSNEELKREIEKRLKEIEGSAKKKASYDNSKSGFIKIATERINRIDVFLSEPLLEEKRYLFIQEACNNLKIKMNEYLTAGNEKVTSGNKIKKPTDLRLLDVDFVVSDTITKSMAELEELIKNDNTTVLYSNISASQDAFRKIEKFEEGRVLLEKQKNSLESIYNEFVKKQKEGLQDFIDTFSHEINEYYQYMNPGELFQEIKIVPMGDEDELNGITIEYKYREKTVSPPQKYFSESHLNCFGIAFFLASVIAFNKENKFLILDDVISSFDTNHRKRFADLLFEKFADWQIILLTHEKEWFQYVKQLAKNKSWLISEIMWSDEKGTHIEENAGELIESIEKKIAMGEVESLGNQLRKYLEHILKVICHNLEVKVSFRFNDLNEKRMPDELLSGLKSKINKCSPELKLKISFIDRVSNSSLLGNLLSHDNPFNPKIGDLKAFWNDIQEFEKLFLCSDPMCKKPKISIKNYDSVTKKIRCGCGKTQYDWKE